MKISKGEYAFYYDESNNIRKLLLAGCGYNIDNDPNQKSSPIFVLAGIALGEKSEKLDFDVLKKQLKFSSDELKFRQMVKIKASYTPINAFKYALGQKRFKTIFEYLISKNIFIHYQAINTVYWSFIDIIDDLIVCTNVPSDYLNEFYYKDCLYRLIKVDKKSFLGLMTKFNYPNIEKKCALAFLKGLDELIKVNMTILISKLEHGQDFKMLMHLGVLVAKCIHFFPDKIDFELVFNSKKNLLIDDFSAFFLHKLKLFPSSHHVLDDESKIEAKLTELRKLDHDLDAVDFSFVVSKLPENYHVQISDVIAGFVMLYFDFLEYASIEEIIQFNSQLSPLQKNIMDSFSSMLDISDDECPGFFHRVIAPIDDHKASILLSGQ